MNNIQLEEEYTSSSLYNIQRLFGKMLDAIQSNSGNLKQRQDHQNHPDVYF